MARLSDTAHLLSDDQQVYISFWRERLGDCLICRLLPEPSKQVGVSACESERVYVCVYYTHLFKSETVYY